MLRYALNSNHNLATMSAGDSQVAAIPVRWSGGRAEVMLITTRRSGRWTVPKGWPLVESLASECAAREAFEEAGVRGRIEPFSLGMFEYWKRSKSGRVFLQVTAYALHVEHMANNWPEREERKRAWFLPEVACRLANNEELATLIRAAVQARAPNAVQRESVGIGFAS